VSLTENQLEMSCRLLQALDRELRKLHRGAITELERSVRGVKDTNGWWQNRVKAGYINTAQLFAVFDFLKLNPVRFMREAVGREDGLELHCPRGEAPEIVGRAWTRFHAVGSGGTLGTDFLKTLDTMRYEAPQRVVELGLEMIDWAPRGKIPRLLGVVGSAWRLMCELDLANHAILAAIQMARQLGDNQELGDLLQRLAYVYSEKPELESALTLAEQATLVHVRSGNRTGAGKTLVDQGIWLYYLDRWAEANAVQRLALEWLPPEESHNRTAAFVNLALNHLKLEAPQLSLEFIELAELEAVGLVEIETARVRWVRGLVLEALGEHDDAAACLEAVLEEWSAVHLGNMALVACDLARVFVRLNRLHEAYRTTLCLRKLVEPLRKNKTASVAIARFLRDAEEAVSFALVQEIRSRIEGELRKRRWWRLLWVERRNT
jgi:tetratricopeptide (TPR) repeat protein